MMTIKKSRSIRSYAVFCMAILLVGAIFLTGCFGEDGTGEDEENKVIPAVEAVEARFGTLPLIQRLNGVVKARNQVAIYPEISAAVVSVEVNNGDSVKKGQPLVRLRDKEFSERLRQARAGSRISAAQLRQAEAQLTEVQAELKRTEALAQQELVSSTELEAIRTQAVSADADVELARARLEQAQASIEEQQENLSQTVIRAPVSGRVGNRNAEVGMLVNGSTRLFTLGQLDSVRVEVVLTDRMLAFIEENQRTEIFAPNEDAGAMEAQLSRISPFLHPVTHSTEAEIDLANPQGYLKAGMFVTADIFYGESEKATLVPLSALYEHPVTGVTGVYISKTDLSTQPAGSGELKEVQTKPLTDPLPFEFVPVEVVAKGRMEAGITGVDAGSWVVTLGQNLLGGRDGTARARPVQWDWVTKLQKLQREDLMEEIIKKQQPASGGSALENEKSHSTR